MELLINLDDLVDKLVVVHLPVPVEVAERVLDVVLETAVEPLVLFGLVTLGPLDVGSIVGPALRVRTSRAVLLELFELVERRLLLVRVTEAGLDVLGETRPAVLGLWVVDSPLERRATQVRGRKDDLCAVAAEGARLVLEGALELGEEGAELLGLARVDLGERVKVGVTAGGHGGADWLVW